MLGTKLLYGKYSTKNVAHNVRRVVCLSAYSILRMREIEDEDGESKLDFLEVTTAVKI